MYVFKKYKNKNTAKRPGLLRQILQPSLAALSCRTISIVSAAKWWFSSPQTPGVEELFCVLLEVGKLQQFIFHNSVMWKIYIQWVAVARMHMFPTPTPMIYGESWQGRAADEENSPSFQQSSVLWESCSKALSSWVITPTMPRFPG